MNETFFDLFQSEQRLPELRMLINAIFADLHFDLVKDLKLESAEIGQETSTSKEAFLDILCTTEKNEWIDVEMQTST